MTTLDLRRLYRPLYTAGAEPGFVDVPPLPFLMVDGAGDPAGEAYLDAVGRLYRAAYRVRAALKASGVVYSVPPLQGRWSDVGDGRGDRSAWRWTMLLQQPAEADPAMHDIEGVRFETFAEGPSVQVLHVGPYAEETPAIERLLAFAARHDREVTGLHHEIYLSDPRRTAPQRLRTIIRYGVTG